MKPADSERLNEAHPRINLCRTMKELIADAQCVDSVAAEICRHT